ncbi:sorbosone dehydrogenase family protein [Rufibacter immobilis]|uniref:Sorbosone dehydrogenase family protein n=1 Tax=Rufibacter immobilis TaxID=1348778 RepID=A0A3M9MWL0_9BACT|nr:sorbosone dehydrogenase family protein [Rufibacter immobilis]RNI29870.1 sorbosone dehydrogenase family protein [Rufibacter immobilis]
MKFPLSLKMGASLLVLLGQLACSSNSGKPDAQEEGERTSAAAQDTVSEEVTEQPATDADLAKITLPDGFQISYYARNVVNARSMALGPDGTLYVGSRDKGSVYALPDKNKDGKVDEIITIASGLKMPNGVALRNGALYVAEISRITRYDNIAENLKNPPAPKVIYDKFPTEEHHGWKYIAFGPDDKLYVPVGAPCNICLRKEPVFAAINRMNPDGSGLEVFASGVRNTVGFDWHPQTKELWFTDNGRDLMGDNMPPDELNRAPKKGMHFGYPFCHAGETLDPEFGKGKNCADYTAPVQKLNPHGGTLGMEFYTGNMFPEMYKNQIFIAEHGSWNRSEKIGYRVSLFRTDAQGKSSFVPFAAGWLQNGKEWGRPVDVEVMPDGSLLVSDDMNDAIYRITYTGNK